MNSKRARLKGFDEFLDFMSPTITDTGYVVVGDPQASTRSKLTVSHTLGLEQNFDHPELILFGFAPPIGAALLCMLAKRLKHRGDQLPQDEPLHGIVQRYPVIIKPVSVERARPFMYAAERWYQRQGRGFRTLQVIWPDTKVRFPWDAGYDLSFASQQPLLTNLQ